MAAHTGNHKAKKHRFIQRDGRVNVQRKGLNYHHSRDWYHWLLTLSWPKMMLFVVVIFLFINLLFAFLYSLCPEGIQGRTDNSFWEFFYFSVQTFGSIGYGVMFPVGDYSNIMVTTQSFLNFCSFGLITGLLFNRFSRPSARVMFSHYAVVSFYEGMPAFIFRAANRRGNQILQAQIQVSLSRNEVTQEGDVVRRVYDLKVLRPSSSFFNLTWTIRHIIDESSPLFNQGPKELEETETEVVVLLSGIDDVYGQTVHGHFSFNSEEILFGHRFVNMFARRDKQRPVVDYSKFDEVEPVSC